MGIQENLKVAIRFITKVAFHERIHICAIAPGHFGKLIEEFYFLNEVYGDGVVVADMVGLQGIVLNDQVDRDEFFSHDPDAGDGKNEYGDDENKAEDFTYGPGHIDGVSGAYARFYHGVLILGVIIKHANNPVVIICGWVLGVPIHKPAPVGLDLPCPFVGLVIGYTENNKKQEDPQHPDRK